LYPARITIKIIQATFATKNEYTQHNTKQNKTTKADNAQKNNSHIKIITFERKTKQNIK